MWAYERDLMPVLVHPADSAEVGQTLAKELRFPWRRVRDLVAAQVPDMAFAPPGPVPQTPARSNAARQRVAKDGSDVTSARSSLVCSWSPFSRCSGCTRTGWRRGSRRLICAIGTFVRTLPISTPTRTRPKSGANADKPP